MFLKNYIFIKKPPLSEHTHNKTEEESLVWKQITKRTGSIYYPMLRNTLC